MSAQGCQRCKATHNFFWQRRIISALSVLHDFKIRFFTDEIRTYPSFFFFKAEVMSKGIERCGSLFQIGSWNSLVLHRFLTLVFFGQRGRMRVGNVSHRFRYVLGSNPSSAALSL